MLLIRTKAVRYALHRCNERTESAMEAPTMKLPSNDGTQTRRAEAARLVALARDILDGEKEQVVGDYLMHALAALDRLRELATAERR